MRFSIGGFVDRVFHIAVHQVAELIIAQLGGDHALSLFLREEHSNQIISSYPNQNKPLLFEIPDLDLNENVSGKLMGNLH